jgi:thioredoxin reductase (NADPH)
MSPDSAQAGNGRPGPGADAARSSDQGEAVRCVDCVVIGAGPAGMTAALYLRRYHRDIAVLDAGDSRARWIPTSHNCPGFPGGVSGDELLARLRVQAAEYGVQVHPTRVTVLKQLADGGFSLEDDSGTRWQSRTVLLATGIVDVLPDVPWLEDAVGNGAMRLCAICDGYEASDTAVAVYGPLESALRHGIFMRSYSSSVTVVASDDAAPDEASRGQADEAGVRIMPRPQALEFDGTRCVFVAADGERVAFDTVYPVLGSRSQSQLAIDLGADVDEEGDLVVTKKQQTSVAGLYAIGDVVSAINQISVAVGHAAVAATEIHNALPGNPR